MRKLMIALTIVGLGLMLPNAADAGCGKKNATIGELKEYDAETKSLTIMVKTSSDPKEVKAKTAKLDMTPDSKVIIEEGKKINSLLGKQVTVVSEHGKIDFVIPLLAEVK